MTGTVQSSPSSLTAKKGKLTLDHLKNEIDSNVMNLRKVHSGMKTLAYLTPWNR